MNKKAFRNKNIKKVLLSYWNNLITKVQKNY